MRWIKVYIVFNERRVQVWRTPKDDYDQDCLLLTTKNGEVPLRYGRPYRSVQLVLSLSPKAGWLWMNISIHSMMKSLLWPAYCWQTLPYFGMIMNPYIKPIWFSFGLRSTEILSNIIPGQHNSQIWGLKPQHNWIVMWVFGAKSEVQNFAFNIVEAIGECCETRMEQHSLETIQTL